MKKKIKNLNDALTYTLENLYDAEKKIQKRLPDLVERVSSGPVKKGLAAYLETSMDKRTKLKRIFSYLLAGPFGRKNKTVGKLLDEGEDVIAISSVPAVRDLILVSTFLSLMQYKITSCQVAREISLHLDLDQVTEILDAVLEWEKESLQSFRKIESLKIVAAQKENLPTRKS